MCVALHGLDYADKEGKKIPRICGRHIYMEASWVARQPLINNSAGRRWRRPAVASAGCGLVASPFPHRPSVRRPSGP